MTALLFSSCSIHVYHHKMRDHQCKNDCKNKGECKDCNKSKSDCKDGQCPLDKGKKSKKSCCHE